MTSRRTRTVVRVVLANPASLTYLALVALAAGWLAVDTLLVDRPDASFAGVPLIVLAAPTIIPLVMGAPGEVPAWWLVLALVLAVLIQSAILGLILRQLRARRGHTPA